MKKIKVGINGFGRIGRAIYRINQLKSLFDIVVVNDINPDTKNIAYLLQYDTTYKRSSVHIRSDKNKIFVGQDSFHVYHEHKIMKVPWDNHGVDVVVDASGVRANVPSMLKDKSGVKNFVITNAPEGFNQIKTIIFGVNEEDCNPNKNKVFSTSICDTIALSPILKILQKTHAFEGH